MGPEFAEIKPGLLFQDMQWISITSPQAILMSHCLQSMVEELVRTSRAGESGDRTFRRPGDGSTVVKEYVHKRQDSTEETVPVRVPTTNAGTNVTSLNNKNNRVSSMARRQYSVQSLTER